MRESKFAIMEAVVDQASRKLGEAQRIENIILDLKEKGISLGVMNHSGRFTDRISDKTKEIITTIVISELNDRMETAAQQLQNILGGNYNGE